MLLRDEALGGGKNRASGKVNHEDALPYDGVGGWVYVGR